MKTISPTDGRLRLWEERAKESGLHVEPPSGRYHYCWGVITSGSWPDVCRNVGTMTWDDAYDQCILLRDVMAIHNS